MSRDLNEQAINAKLRNTENFMQNPRYREYFEMLEDSPLASIRKKQGAISF